MAAAVVNGLCEGKGAMGQVGDGGGNGGGGGVGGRGAVTVGGALLIGAVTVGVAGVAGAGVSRTPRRPWSWLSRCWVWRVRGWRPVCWMWPPRLSRRVPVMSRRAALRVPLRLSMVVGVCRVRVWAALMRPLLVTCAVALSWVSVAD